MVSETIWENDFRPRTLIKVQFIALLFYGDAFGDRQRVRENE